MKIHNDFIGHDEINQTLSFIDGDTETAYRNNLSKQPDDWYYKDKQITYKLNSLGHRCNDIKDINLDNYMLFAGCSNTFGVGVELEKTYAYISSKELGCDYYNLSLGATGIDILEHNLLTWFLKIKQKPRYLVIQWPDHGRFLNIDSTGTLTPMGLWSPNKNVGKFISDSEEEGVTYARKLLAVNNIFNVSKCPYATFVISGSVPYTIYDNTLVKPDYARDLSHPGIKSNSENAEILVKILTENT